MNRLQAHLFQLLREIRDICDANGITYYLIGGTLIGAMRNRGFLPWDDDADIAMRYDDYMRFKEACKTQLPPNRYLGDATEDETYGHLLPRYMSTDTTQFHTAQSLNDCVSGVVIDIFVLDPIADGDEAYRGYLQDMFLYSSIVNYANVAAYRVELDVSLYEQYAAIAEAKGKAHAVRLIEQRMVSHFDGAGSKYAYRWQAVPWLLERAWFEEGQDVEFEGEAFTAPKQVNGNLIGYFGDDWPMVPALDAVKVHDTGTSLDFAYDEVRRYFHPAYAAEELLEGMERRKRQILRDAHIANGLRDEWADIRTKVAELELRDLVCREREEFDAAFEARDGKRLADLLDGYLAWQVSGDAIGRHTDKLFYRRTHPRLVPVDDDAFEAALIALLETDRVRFVSRLLEIRRDRGLPLTGGMDRIARDVETLRASMADLEHGDYAEGLRKARALVDAYPDVRWFAVIACANACKLWRETAAAEDLRAYEELAERCVERFPAEGAFRKAKADCLAARGLDAQAHDLYLIAAETTRDGMALLEIADITGYHPSWLRSQKWAPDAGVPAWNGDVPEIPKEMADARKRGQESAIGSPKQVYVWNLLMELCDLCEGAGVDYVLAPNIAYSLVRKGMLPANVGDFAIVCHPRRADALIGALSKRVAERGSRAFEYMGNNLGAKAGEVVYYATDSLFLTEKMTEADARKGVRVRAVFIEPVKRPEPLASKLAQWCDASSSVAGKAALFAKVRGGKLRRDGARLFTALMKQSAESKQHVYAVGGKKRKFDARYIEKRRRIDVGDGSCFVPLAINEYLKLAIRPSKIAAPRFSFNKIVSETVNFDQLFASSTLDAGYFARRAKYDGSTAEGRKALKRFRLNFAQLKNAVQTKRFADELLPRKGEIRHMREVGDWEGLRDVLGAYAAFCEKVACADEAMFDEEIYGIVRELGK